MLRLQCLRTVLAIAFLGACQSGIAATLSLSIDSQSTAIVSSDTGGPLHGLSLVTDSAYDRLGGVYLGTSSAGLIAKDTTFLLGGGVAIADTVFNWGPFTILLENMRLHLGIEINEPTVLSPFEPGYTQAQFGARWYGSFDRGTLTVVIIDDGDPRLLSMSDFSESPLELTVVPDNTIADVTVTPRVNGLQHLTFRMPYSAIIEDLTPVGLPVIELAGTLAFNGVFTTEVPEPGSFVLAIIGTAACLSVALRRRK